MARVSLAFAVVLATATVVASSANAGGDPRVCYTSDHRPVPRIDCARGAAKIAFRRYMAQRFDQTGLWSGYLLNCRAFVGFLRFGCTFENFGMSGYAVVSLGKASAWKPTVTVKQIVCVEDVDRPGCRQ